MHALAGRLSHVFAVGLLASLSCSDAFAGATMQFEANVGQVDARVDYLARGQGYQLFLTRSEAVFRFRDDAGQRAMRLGFGTVPTAPRPLTPLPGVSRYHGATRAGSKIRSLTAAHFGRIRYDNLHPGIDLEFYDRDGQLEFDWIVAPGADPAPIRFSFTGIDSLTLDADGALQIQTGAHTWRQQPPIARQKGLTGPESVTASYRVTAANEVAITLGDYDTERALVIDPVLIYATLLGGSGNENNFTFVGSLATGAIAVDATGHAWVAGATDALDFPVTSGALDPTPGGGICAPPILGTVPCPDAFVAKLSPDGQALLVATYLGGGGDDAATGIDIDQAGNITVVGVTGSPDFPVAGSPLQATPGGGDDGFVTRLSPDGATLLYSTYLGGNGADEIRDVRVDEDGRALVTGVTGSADFPVTAGALQPLLGGGRDAFVSALQPGGDGLAFSTFLGASENEAGNGIEFDSHGHVLVAGSTNSSDFPTTTGAFDRSFGGGQCGFVFLGIDTRSPCTDGFVAKLAPEGDRLHYSTFLGGERADSVNDIALDPRGNTHVVGSTQSEQFPVLDAVDAEWGGGSCGVPDFASACTDAFVTVLDPRGRAPLFSTYLGGSRNDAANAITLDDQGRTVVAGFTGSHDFRILNAFDQDLGPGDSDGFIARINTRNAILDYASYHGGTGSDTIQALAAGRFGSVHATGWTRATDMPLAAPLDAIRAGSSDAFVARISSGEPLCDITLAADTHEAGDTVIATHLWVANPESTAKSVAVKLWFGVPDGTVTGPLPSSDAPFTTLPPGFAHDFGPVTVATLEPDAQPGRYGVHCRLLDPTSGDVLSEDRNMFRVPAG